METFTSYIVMLTVIVSIFAISKSVEILANLAVDLFSLLEEPEANKKQKHEKPKTESNKYIESVAKEYKIFKEAANEFELNINKHPNAHLIISKDYLKSKYREKAKKFHPDHGGSEEAFIRVKQAYDILLSRAI